MIDTHCHIDNKQFDSDRAATLERAFADGMTHLIIPAIEPTRFQTVLNIVRSDERIFCGMGIHPHHALEASSDALRQVEDLSFSERVQAIGEIGLDYHYDFAPRDVQQDVFRAQLRIAKRRNLPVIVHNRESDDDMMRILDEEQDGSLRGVLHCFSGTPEQAERAVNLGFHVSFTGNITFKASTLSETVASVPMNTLMIETDAPYMSPVPHRGKRNEPAFVRLVAEKIAEIRSMSLEDVLTTTSATAHEFFRIPTRISGGNTAQMLIALLLSCLAFVSTQTAFAQSEEEDDTPVPFVNPYPKTFGIGGVAGAHTLIDVHSPSGTLSYTGQAIIYGGNMRYYFTDAIALDAGYYTGNNFAPTVAVPGGSPPQPFPNRFQAIDAGLYFTTNPGNTLNVSFGVGASYLISTFNAGPTTPPDSSSGFGAHLKLISVGLNVPTSFGLLYPGAELHINGAFFSPRDKDYGNGTRVQQIGYLYSVIRATLYWFPSFGTGK
ncbi:MAG: TatD family deoxyribonuclease [Candidatus Kapaibacterium sp.]|nr:MAG: TatD family deoxyribonuclease [Candidatus Kapabacteria bacterium]